MLLEFRSKATGGFFMMPHTFREVCRALDFEYAESGAWQPEVLPGYLAKLEETVELERKRIEEQRRIEREQFLAGLGFLDPEKEKEEQERHDNLVSFGQRTYPLRDMISLSIKAGVPVMWGIP